MKVASIVGARPQFIKAAPVSRAIERYAQEHPDSGLREILVHTGQHYDYEMSEIFFRELDLKKPDYHLGVGSGSHAHQIGEMLKGIEAVLLEEKPDWALVYGDTNSTLAGALAAAHAHVPVAHVEAGLRSFNRGMPEETNRVLTDHVSSLLFCPTETAVKNLAREGIAVGVHLVGDVMCDALLANLEEAGAISTILSRLELRPREYFLATVHRAENTDDAERLGGIVEAFRKLGGSYPVIWPVHPRTRQALESYHLSPSPGAVVRLIDPISYRDMLMLEKAARLILTDSGGVQKEAYLLGVPCVTLREETEWLETVQAGWNRLAGVVVDRIVDAVSHVPRGPRRPLYGDGGAAKQIAEILANGSRPA
ncbi:MAG: UDP-N-acetylglucosamine 2-epimerase (non-hydrolyzing) [Acidobacteria bacterium]|nr:UDP-N-acetylglucosamine 2-epimerase (non-hydrolyzing) [Acidobacteriota bacterium]